jgi:hypothetical protein
MSRVSYRQVRDRFTHIDAEFVRARCELGAGGSEYVVRFYPWWEHPAYLEARARNLPWAFGEGSSSGAKEVTVLPVCPTAFKLSARSSVTDWAFPAQHPILWKYENETEIFLNSDVLVPALIDAVLDRQLPYVTRATLHEYINPIASYRAPYSLGYFPTPLFRVVRDVLAGMGARIFVDSREPVPREVPVLFLIDDDDYIVADDFEIEVPDFEHLDAWFCPDLDRRRRE